MCNQKLLTLLLLLTAAAIVSSDTDVEIEEADANSLSTSAPGAQQQQQVRNIVKRAPTSSFIGMRGKKELDSTANVNWLGPDPLDYGEDDSNNYYTENGRRLKKAPLAFVGVRGKKNTYGHSHLQDLLQQVEEERLRESLLQDFLEHLTIDGTDVAKRAPIGFTGMRGKRPSLAQGDGGDSSDADALELLEKRTPVNSFVGVRGKKDLSHQHYKRAALSEAALENIYLTNLGQLWLKIFKKAYDMRGKKQRYAELNSKFVAVRGKKSDQSDDNIVPQNLVQPWVYFIGDKRAPNGFVGMRGKRPALAD